MKNILSLLLILVCLAQCGTAEGQDDNGIKLQGKGWILKTDSTLILTKDYDGEGFGEYDNYFPQSVNRLVIEEGVTSTENWKLGQLFDIYYQPPGAYRSNSYLYSITLPKSLKRVSGLNYNISGEKYPIEADTIYAPWENPVDIEIGVFARARKYYTRWYNSVLPEQFCHAGEEHNEVPLLIVPKGRIEAYKASDWSKIFAYIGDEKGKHKWPCYKRDDCGWTLSVGVPGYPRDTVISISKDFKWSGGPEWFDYPNAERKIKIEEGVKEVGNHAFSGRDIGFVYCPKSLEIIGDGAFSNVMHQVYMGENNVEYVGKNAFGGLKLECVRYTCKLPKKAKYVGDYAFYETFLIVDTLLPGELEYIGDYAFYGADLSRFSKLSLSLPQSLKHIGEGAFSKSYFYVKNDTLTLPEGLEYLGGGGGLWRFCVQPCQNSGKFKRLEIMQYRTPHR